MSQENVEILLEGFRRVEAGEMNRLPELMDPRVVMTAMDDWPEQGPFIGPDAVVAQWERIRADWEEQRFTDIEVVADAGDWVVTEYRWHVRGAGSGIETDFDLVLAVKLKGGVFTEIHYRWNREEALEAAGLRD